MCLKPIVEPCYSKWALVSKVLMGYGKLLKAQFAPDFLNHNLHFNKIPKWCTGTLRFEKLRVAVLFQTVSVWCIVNNGGSWVLLPILENPGKAQFILSLYFLSLSHLYCKFFPWHLEIVFPKLLVCNRFFSFCKLEKKKCLQLLNYIWFLNFLGSKRAYFEPEYKLKIQCILLIFTSANYHYV